MLTIFAKQLTLIVVYDDPSLYLEASKRQNIFFKPNRKKHIQSTMNTLKFEGQWIKTFQSIAHI